MTYQVIERLPSIEEYRALCTAVGWQDVMNFEAAVGSLARSLYGVVVTHEGQTVGMGRLVGDGFIYFYVQDIAVLPEHQGQGVRRMIMEGLMRYIRANAPKQAFVGLFSTAGQQPFYAKWGFMTHEALTGMFTVPNP